MRSRPHKYLAAIALLPLAAGCVQATRHSNTMYFGTNTTFGIKAGASTGEVPEIIVGYDRQEAVVMPLLANTVDTSEDGYNRLGPCPVTDPIEVTGGIYAIHPCSFVSIKGGNLDSYSVLASFGAEFGAGASTDVDVNGGLAQYFATGMAAQILSAKGGAALVSTNAATINANDTPLDVNSLFPANTEFGVGMGKNFDTTLDKLKAKVVATDKTILKRKMQGLVDAINQPFGTALVNACSEQGTCITAIEGSAPAFLRNAKFNEGVAKWDEY